MDIIGRAHASFEEYFCSCYYQISYMMIIKTRQTFSWFNYCFYILHISCTFSLFGPRTTSVITIIMSLIRTPHVKGIKKIEHAHYGNAICELQFFCTKTHLINSIVPKSF